MNRNMHRIARGCALGLLAAALAACGGRKEDTRAFEQVAPGPLVIAVHGQGELKATKATPLLVPGRQWSPRQLAWVLPDGSPVKQGDLVARFSATQSEQDLEQALVDLQRNAIARLGKQGELAQNRGQLDTDIAQVATQLAIARRYANAGTLALARNEVLDAVQDERFLDAKQGTLDWRRAQSETRGQAELAVLDAQRATYDINARQRQQDLDALELRAPHDGVLMLQGDWSGQKPRVGAALWAGGPLASLPDTAALEVELAIPQVQAQGIRVGDRVELHPAGAPGQTVVSKVGWIAAAAQRRNRENPVKYLLMKAPVPADAGRRFGWTPGRQFEARIVLLDAKDAVSVPNLALHGEGARTGVQLLRNGRVEERAVKLGVRGASRSQVLEGLSVGDRVLLTDDAKDEASGETKGETKDEAKEAGA